MDKLPKRVVAGVVVGAAVYAVMAATTDVSRLVDHLAAVPVGVVAAALGLSMLNYGLRFAKWQLYLRRLELAVPAGSSLHIFLAGMVMSVTPGKLGEVLKSGLLKQRHDLPVARTAPIVLAERMTDLLGLFVLASVGILTFDFGRAAFAAAVAVIAAVLVVLNRPEWVAVVLDWFEKLAWVGRFRDTLEQAYQSVRVLLTADLVAVTTALSTVGWAMEAVALYLILEAIGATHLSLELAAFVFSMSTILGAISLLPGGLGVAETSMIGVLLALGVVADQPAAAAATYLIRLVTLWFGVALGLVALVTYQLAEIAPPEA